MRIHRGTTIETAIEIPFKLYEQHNVEYKINCYIDEMFGLTDGDYFVKAAQFKTDLKGQQFKIVLIEDRDREQHQVYFKLIPLEPDKKI